MKGIIDHQVDLFIEEFYDSVQDIFRSKKELAKYYRAFDRLRHVEASVTLTTVCRNLTLINDLETLNRPYSSILIFLMITSIIEILYTFEPYQEFQYWLSQNGGKKKIIGLFEGLCNQYNLGEQISNKKLKKMRKLLFDDYNEKHGCTRKFRKFFQECLHDDEKFQLLRMVRKNQWPKDDVFVPFCYQKDPCQGSIRKLRLTTIRYVKCKFEVEPNECPMKKSRRTMEENLIKFSSFLYSIRSRFVHSGNIPIFITKRPSAKIFPIIDYVKTNKFTGEILYELDMKFLLHLLEKYLPKMLDDFLKSQPVLSKSMEK